MLIVRAAEDGNHSHAINFWAEVISYPAKPAVSVWEDHVPKRILLLCIQAVVR